VSISVQLLSCNSSLNVTKENLVPIQNLSDEWNSSLISDNEAESEPCPEKLLFHSNVLILHCKFNKFNIKLPE
jgi:hypothetical protein